MHQALRWPCSRTIADYPVARESERFSLSFFSDGAITYAHLIAGRYDQASLSAANALRGRPSYLTALRGAAASNALAGRLTDAKTLVAQARGLDSTLCLSKLKGLFPFRRTCDFDRWAEGLQRAGVPD